MKISDIIDDEEIYPRNIKKTTGFYWQTAFKYSEAMKMGGKFPPVVVGLFNGKYYLIDGKHRLKAYETVGVDEVEVVVKSFSSKKDMLIAATELNVKHGVPLTPYDKTDVILALRKYGVSDLKIAKIVQVPFEKVSSFVVKRVVNTLSGEPVSIKAPLRSLVKGFGSGGSVVLSEEQKAAVEEQGVLSNVSELQLLDSVLVLLEGRAVNLRNPVVVDKLKRIHKACEVLILGLRKK